MRTRSLLAAATVACLAAAGIAAGQQDERARTEAQAQRAAARIQALHEEADRLAREERTVLNELRRFEVERQLRAEEFAEADRKRQAVEDQIGALDGQIGSLEAQERVALPALRARLINLYKLGRGSYTRLLFSTADLAHLPQASRMISVLATEDRHRIEQHQALRTELTTARTALEQQQANLAGLQAAAARARAAADAAVAARNARVREIDEHRDLNAQLTGELVSAEQRLQTTLAGLTPAAPAAAPSPGSAALPLRPFRGDLDWPVSGALRQRFGATPQGRAMPSSGVDLAADEGAEVHAIHEGRVAFADSFSGFGRLVIVEHGAEIYSLYANLKDISVKPNDRLERGDVVGTVGVSPTGASGLYFELRVDGRPVDPLQWLKVKP